MTKFTDLGLNEAILRAVADMGFETPSEIQAKAIPILLEADTDMVSLAQTGTGKTAAFGFPLIQKIDANSKTTQGLILSPTRELCMQITNELKNYSKFIPSLNIVAIYGGASINDQARDIKRGAQIIVATPGRMKDMISRRMIDISKIEYCVLDEADEMLNMGFYEDITEILSHSPKEKSTWLFSATMPKEVSTIAKKFMKTPVEITVGTRNTGTKNVSHEYYLVNARDRYQALRRLADAHPDIFSVVFCRTKRDTQKVAENLIEDGYNAAALHGDLSQSQRDMVMKSFRNRQIQMLVATDVAARGIDVDDITHVINYQLPDEIEIYTHRSGRTGRAGKNGVSITIVSKSEVRKIRSIEKIIQQKFVAKEIPNGMEICKIQLFHLANNIKNTEINKDLEAYLPSINEVLGGLTKEDLINKVFSVEFSRFYDHYKKTKDLNVIEAGNDRGERETTNEDTVRYFINIGSKDGFDWMSLKDFLRDLINLGKDDVYRVDVKDSFSFFNTDSSHQELVLSIFEDFKLEGRHVNVEISKDGGGSGGGKNRGNRRRRDDGGGERRERGGSDRGTRNDRGGSERPQRNERGGSRFEKKDKKSRDFKPRENSKFSGGSNRRSTGGSDNKPTGTGGRRRRM
ncbi:MAG: ATP-dependent RNA helicase [Flavobacteriaceae bacterium CG02_land_8_20_14_3_00_34_13]|nr:DEAD/DEAH box helicase [Flavobacteriia bacterium]PIV49090.1 MAG: ATP-dependent RNA helicase [Flavobacteriaceae bacterium CG02_land_8_20_14_3_00_34_13]PJC07485.1 MAG: ATP-dependent RNA helicase [Flavobacteriaceae bacterium CG_4_9_14_0_8_um_filter_34_30]